MRKSILDCDVRRVPVILEHKVIRDDAMHGGIPLDVWVFLVVIYEERDAGSGESFGCLFRCQMGFNKLDVLTLPTAKCVCSVTDLLVEMSETPKP